MRTSPAKTDSRISVFHNFFLSFGLAGTFLLGTMPTATGAADSSNSKIAQAASPAADAETGIASYYGAQYDGQPTASGEVFDMNALTAAHPRLPFGTRLRVTHLGNHRSVVVRVNDRGPFVKGRIIDLSQAAAQELQMVASGLAEVKIEIVK